MSYNTAQTYMEHCIWLLSFNNNASSYPVEMVLSMKTLNFLGHALLHLRICEHTQSYGQL